MEVGTDNPLGGNPMAASAIDQKQLAAVLLIAHFLQAAGDIRVTAVGAGHQG